MRRRGVDPGGRERGRGGQSIRAGEDTLAREAGASDALPPDRAADVDAEIVFETAGAASAVATSMAAARRGARILVLGGHPVPSPVDLLDLTVREIALQGSVSHCFEDFVRAAQAITAGEVARTHRPITFAPLEQGPALLLAEESSSKRILRLSRSMASGAATPATDGDHLPPW